MARRQRSQTRAVIIDEDEEQELPDFVEIRQIVEQDPESVEPVEPVEPVEQRETFSVIEVTEELAPTPISELVQDAPVAEDLEATQIYQSYHEAEEPLLADQFDELDEPDESDDAPVVNDKSIVLLDYFPTTPEEYEQGFRRISPKEKKAWGITHAEEEYDTIPGMAATLGIARNTAENWIYQCVEFFPTGFLKTRHGGLTTECLKVLELYRDYCGGENYTKARKNRFLKKLEEQLDQYTNHLQAYYNKKAQEQEESSSSSLTHIPALDGEFVDERTQLQLQVSFERSDRAFNSGTSDYAKGKIAAAILDTYQASAKLKPLMDQAIQNGLTGKDLPNLSEINKL
jgi:hypothetical protein